MTKSRAVRRRWWVALAILFALVIATMTLGPTIAKPFVRAKLQAMIRDQLNARLEVGSLAYSFPYGVVVGDAQLIATDSDGREFDLLSAKQLSLELAKLPIGSGPLVIRSVVIDSPAVHLIQTNNGLVGRGITVKTDQPTPVRTQKLSEMLRLERLALNDGQIVYEDRTVGGAVPLAWRGLHIDLRTGSRSESGSDYAFALVAGAGKSATLNAAGSLDIDDLIIHLRECAVRVNVDRSDASDSPLPADLQPLLREYQISGALAIDISGDVPLADPKHANVTAAIDLSHASGRLPGAQSPLDELSLKVTTRAQEIAPNAAAASILKLSIERLIARGRDTSLTFDGGTIILNDATRAWGASDVKFAISAGRDRSALPRAIVEMLDRTAAQGAFVCMFEGSGEIGSLAHTDAQLHIAPQNLTVHPPGMPLPLTDFADVTIRLADGIATAENVRAGYGDDVLLISEAAVRLTDLPNVLQLDRLRGCVTFARQVANYPAPVAEYLAQVEPHGPFWFAGAARVDLAKPFDDPSALDYRLRITTDRGGFSTRQHHVPLYNVNLDVALTPSIVAVNRFDADVLSGKLSLTGNVDLPAGTAPPSYAAQVRVRGVDLNSLAQLFAPADGKPMTVAGELSADVTLSGSGADAKSALDALRADGAVQVINGELLRVPVLDRIADQVGRSRLATVGEAGGTFTLAERTVRLTDAVVGSPALGVRGRGDIGFDGTLALTVIATPLNDWDRQVRRDNGSAVRNTVATVAGQVQSGLNSVTEKYLYRLKVSGNVNQPEVTVIAAPSLQEK